MPSTLSKNTKINLALTAVLVTAAGSGAYFISSLVSRVEGVGEALQDVKVALDRNTAQLAHDGRALAVMQTQIDQLKDEIRTLRQKR